MLFSLKEHGQSTLEYALILVLVVLIVIAALALLGPIVADMYRTVNANV